MAAGGVGPAQHNSASGSVSNGAADAAAAAAATQLHSSAASTADGYDSDGYSFAPL
jgi:hypothetical protein